MQKERFTLFTGLWVGEKLPPMAQLCMKSFIDNGCDFQLFCYKEFKDIPDGVRIRDANMIIPETDIFLDNAHHSLGPFADWFRWKWLYEEGGFWVDMDVICLDPLNIPDRDLLFYKQNSWEMSIGILKFPAKHNLAYAMKNIAYDPAWIAPWYSMVERQKYEALKKNVPDVSERRRRIPWGWAGPIGMTRAVKHFKLMEYALAPNGIFQTPYTEWRNLYNGAAKVTDINVSKMWCTHLWGEMLRYQPGMWDSRTKNSMVSYLWSKHMSDELVPEKIKTEKPEVKTKYVTLDPPLKCVFIINQGEVAEGAMRALQLGYEVELFPVEHNLVCLTDLYYDESFEYIGRSPESTERSHVRSLRASYIKALRCKRYAGQDNIIFCESDAVPLLPATELYKLIEEVRAQHSDIDIYRMFYASVWEKMPISIPKLPKGSRFDPMEKFPERDPCTRQYWGTHALLIPTKSREKMARIFSDYRMPTDVAVVFAQSRDMAKVYITSHNFFVQLHRAKLPKDWKIVGMLHSNSELRELQRQIWCMMDQNYSDFHLNVAASGISEEEYKIFLEQQFSHFIASGRLTLHYCQETTPLSNLLDTIRGTNINSADLYVSLSDREFYSHDLMLKINNFHRMLDKGIGSYTAAPSGAINYLTPLYVLPQRAISMLFDYEKDPTTIPELKGDEDLTTILNRVTRLVGACDRSMFI